MATSSNIEPRQVAFCDPAHVNCQNLAVRWGGDGRSQWGREENRAEAAAAAAAAAARRAQRRHLRCVSAMLVVGVLG